MNADATSPEERLRTALDAAASAPVPEAWDAIRDRLADPPLTLDLRPPSSSRPGRRPARVLSVAAGVLVLLAGAVALLTRDGDEPSPVVTGPAQATGWYVPVGLPDGWRVVQVGYHSSTICAQRGQRWVAESGDAAVTVTRSDCSGTPWDDDDAVGDQGSTTVGLGGGTTAPQAAVDLGGGVTATLATLAGDEHLGWRHDGRWVVRGVGATTDQVLEVGRAAVADPSLAFSLPGFSRFDGWDHPAIEAAPAVQVDLVDPKGTQVGFDLSLPGTGMGRNAIAIPRVIPIPGQELPVVALGRADGSWTRDIYAGSWPGADLTGYVSIPPPDLSDMTPEERCAEMAFSSVDRAKPVAEASLGQLVAALRPATTTEWRAFLATAETAASALSGADDLAGLIEAPAPIEAPGPPPTTQAPPEPITFTCPPP